MTAVDSGSALLDLPDSIEAKMPVNADHSQIVKFDSRNAEAYKAAIGYLKQFERDAKKVISGRFCTGKRKRLAGDTDEYPKSARLFREASPDKNNQKVAG